MKNFKIFIFCVSVLALVGYLIVGDYAASGVALASAGVAFPFGQATLLTPAYSATLAVTITDQLVILKPAAMTGSMTINLTLPPDLHIGAMLLMELLSDTTARTVTFGTGFTAPTLAGTISKTNSYMFVYDGTSYVPMGAAQLQS